MEKKGNGRSVEKLLGRLYRTFSLCLSTPRVSGNGREVAASQSRPVSVGKSSAGLPSVLLVRAFGGPDRASGRAVGIARTAPCHGLEGGKLYCVGVSDKVGWPSKG